MKYGIKLMAWFCLLFLMVLSVVGVIGWGRKDHHTIEKHTPQRSSVDTSAAWEKIEPHLAASDEATKKALFNACNRVDQFFAEKRSRVRSFAEEALSLRSKWRLVKGKLPGTDSEGHMHFLRERFEALVFSSKELAEVIRAATEEYVENLRGIENELLINIRADLDDKELSVFVSNMHLNSDESFLKDYSRSLQEVAARTTRDLGVMVGREVVAWVGADIAANIGISVASGVASRLGVSTAILSTGAGSTVTTLGIGLVAGIVIDNILDWVLQGLGYDAVADVDDEINLALDEFREVLIAGVVPKPLDPIVLQMPKELGGEQITFLTARDRSRHERAVERWRDWERRHPEAKDKYSGFSWELYKVYANRAQLRNAALENLLQKGAGK